MRNIFLLLFVTLSLSKCYAQISSIKIIRATQQSWSGGVEGHYGEKFFVEFQTPKDFVPDTFHLNGYDIPIQFYPGSAKTNFQYNCAKTVKGNITTYKLNLNYSYPNEAIYRGENPYDSNSDLPKQKKYLCKYELKFKSGEVICITKYEILEPLSYP